MTANVLEMRQISKSFSGVVACSEVNLRVAAGEVHCLLGENGAGKSTLMKVLSGSYKPDAGTVHVNGEPVTLVGPQDGYRAGISVIYQELDLFPDLTVAQNLFLGHSPSKVGVLNRNLRRRMAQEYLQRVGGGFSPDAVVGSLPIADQQLTAIARSLTSDARIIVMDEPTATLGESDVAKVYSVIRNLIREGRSVIYISHRLAEVEEVGDTITVLRDGRNVAEFSVRDSTRDDWVKEMIGEKVGELTEVNPRNEKIGSSGALLEVERVAVPGLIDIAGIDIRPGEIVGLAGLAGAGRTTFLAALFGAMKSHHKVNVNGRSVRLTSPRKAVDVGFGLVPENRKTDGLMTGLSIARNAGITAVGQPPWLMPRERGKTLSKPVLNSLSAKYASIAQPVGELSGGNQQKVVLAKWLVKGIRVLLLDEPTRGLDIGAKAELYREVRKLADEGAAVLVGSSELSELIANSDRIVVFHEGKNVAQFDPRIDKEEVISQTIISGRIED